MKKPIILPKKKLYIDAEDIFAVWYPYLVNEDKKEQYELTIWLVKNNVKGECFCLYDTLEDVLTDYNFLIEVLKK